jgi:hypothetical protein
MNGTPVGTLDPLINIEKPSGVPSSKKVCIREYEKGNNKSVQIPLTANGLF